MITGYDMMHGMTVNRIFVERGVSGAKRRGAETRGNPGFVIIMQ
jgi:hypothetical protein